VTKGGAAFIPTLKGGVFPLRPLHPREINPIRAADKLLGYIFTSLYEAFPFPTAELGPASEQRDPLYMGTGTNQSIG
jgi:hypothetical protein